MSKWQDAGDFEIRIDTPEEFDGELGYFVLRNQRGRTWRQRKATETEYLSEQIDVLADYIADGNKLNRENWVEV